MFSSHWSAIVRPSSRQHLQGRSSELRSGPWGLEDVKVPVFTLFVDWLYTQEIEREHSKFHSSTSTFALYEILANFITAASGEGLRILDFFKLWVLGQHFLIPRLQNAAISTSLFIEFKEDFIDEDQQSVLVEVMHTFREQLFYAYENTARIAL